MTKPALARYWSTTENAGRGYIRPSTGEQVPGVTSITKLVDKDLAQWGANMAVQWMAENWYAWNPGGKSTESAVNHAKYRWKDFRDERGAVGTGVHEYIEESLEGLGPFVDDLDVEQQQMIHQWEEFCFFTGVEFVGTECTVFGDDYAGTLDAYGIINGKLMLLDWKTSKRCHPEYFMQLAALKNAHTVAWEVPQGTEGAFLAKGAGDAPDAWFVEAPAMQVDGAALVHLRGEHWDGKKFTPAKWEVIELDNERLHMVRFEAYKAAWYAESALRKAGVKLDRPVDKEV